jgi:hypothetical protein
VETGCHLLCAPHDWRLPLLADANLTDAALRSRAQLFSEPLLSTPPTDAAPWPPASLGECPHRGTPLRSAACHCRPFDLASPALVESGLIPIVSGCNRAGLCSSWLEKARFEARTGGMAESDRRTCYCRAVYRRTQIIAVACEISSFECELCGTTLETWNSSWVPRYRLIAGPIRMPNDSQTP